MKKRNKSKGTLKKRVAPMGRSSSANDKLSSSSEPDKLHPDEGKAPANMPVSDRVGTNEPQNQISQPSKRIKVKKSELVEEWRMRYRFGDFDIWIFDIFEEFATAPCMAILDHSQQRIDVDKISSTRTSATLVKQNQPFKFMIEDPAHGLCFDACPKDLKSSNFLGDEEIDLNDTEKSLLKASIKKILSTYSEAINVFELARIFEEELGSALQLLNLDEIRNSVGSEELSKSELIILQDVVIQKLNSGGIASIPNELHSLFTTYYVNSGQKALFLCSLGDFLAEPIEELEILAPIDAKFFREFIGEVEHWPYYSVLNSGDLNDKLKFRVIQEFIYSNFSPSIAPYFSEAALRDLNFELSPEDSFLLGLHWSCLGNFTKATDYFSNSNRVYFRPNGRGKQITEALKAITKSVAKYQTAQLEKAFGGLPSISIIIPVFNAERYVDETLASIFAQEYPNLEVIFVDGGSSDQTVEIAKKYGNKITKLISEPDEGQSQAINKGLKHATGELVTWLNGDDILFPNALRVIASNYLLSDADLIAGGIIEFEQTLDKPTLYNRALREGAELTVKDLSDLYGRWFKGHFFYQPEVFFKRTTLMQLDGPVDEQLYFTMDYDLWLRLSERNVSIVTVDHPICLFRKHENQKTNDLFLCTEEQFKVLRKTVGRTPVDRQKLIKFNAAKMRPQTSVSFYSSRAEKIFYPNYQNDINLEEHKFVPLQGSEEPNWVELSHLILAVHLQNDVERIRHIREKNPDITIIGWFWDNHHHFEANFEVAKELDAYFAGHTLNEDYLRFSGTPYLGHLPLCMTQFSPQIDWQPKPFNLRSDQLHSGHVYYPFAGVRQDALVWLRDASGLDKEMMRFMHDGKYGDFSKMTIEEKFLDWSKCKVSLQVPLNNDLSQRMFDCLLAGTIPLVSKQCEDFWGLFSEKDVKALNLVSYDILHPSSIREAFEKAVSEFDQAGERGIKARHEWAKHHFLQNRLQHAAERIFSSRLEG